MDPPFSEGEQPSSYTNQQIITGADQQSNCLSELSNISPYYSSSPVAQELSPHPSDTSSLTPASSTYYQHQQQHLRSTQSLGALASMASGPQNVPRSHHIWPSPSPGSDELDNYSNNSSPTCGSSQHGYHTSPVSPKTWSSPHHTCQQTSDPFPQLYTQDHLKLHMCGSPSTNTLPFRSSPASMSLAKLDKCADETVSSRDSSLIFPHALTNGNFSATSSPAALDLDAGNYASVSNKSDAPTTSGLASSADSGPKQLHDQGRTNKGEVPYAQLIYRAFMSRPGYSMTLQEIYQWFRENTDRAKSVGKGWQNSIRHNLSMNAAFTKRERKSNSSTSVTIVGDQVSMPAIHDPKKSTEWVLADWAVRNGVQSTTRYRKGNPSRSRGHNKLASHGFQYGFQYNGGRISPKAASGRKGGYAAGRTRLRGRHFNQDMHPAADVSNPALAHGGLPISPLSIRPMMPSGIFSSYGDPQIGIKHDGVYSPLTQDTTAPNPSFGLMLPDPSLTSQQGTPSNTAIQDTTYYQGSMYSHFPYGANDVAGVFNQQQTQPQHSTSGQASLAAGDNGSHFGTMF
ncbi:hypothetical protein BGZ63DRAFT_399069 [Mariannaea sp. PMI_226]|nr:hypothetical protein BGZ63DRAFT_399069 [Mariannaea sp. PMI_226]